MCVHKLKWSLEEEAALKAAVIKYGIGKWVAILKDQKFGSVLHLRSKVDLKDKWRKMRSRMAGEFRSCQRVKPWIPTHTTENCGNITSAPEQDFMKTDPSTTLALSLQNRTSKMPMPRLDSLILDTIDTLKESVGSTPTAIAKNITDNYLVPSNFKELLKAELEALIDCGILKKVKHRYRVTPSSYSGLDKNPFTLPLEVKQEGCLSGTKFLTKADIDAELEKMRIMTPRQAAAMAVKVVAEAEAALLEAEKAAREAEVAEADAESAKAFAAAAMRAVKQTTLCIW